MSSHQGAQVGIPGVVGHEPRATNHKQLNKDKKRDMYTEEVSISLSLIRVQVLV